MDMDELVNGTRVRHIMWDRTGTVEQHADLSLVRMDDGTEYEVCPWGDPSHGDVRPEDLEPAAVTR